MVERGFEEEKERWLAAWAGWPTPIPDDRRLTPLPPPHTHTTLFLFRRGWTHLCGALRFDLTHGLFNSLRAALTIPLGELKVKPFHDANASHVAGQTEEQTCVGR